MYVTDGAMNGVFFKAWVEQMLAPELRPGDIVVMDNLPAHKVAGIRQAIEARDAKLDASNYRSNSAQRAAHRH